MSDPDLIKQAWKASASDPAVPDIAMVRAGADHFYRKVHRRNAIEYAACIVVFACFSAYAILLPSPTARIGAAMIVLGTLVVVWQLHRRASAVRPPEGAAADPILLHQRAQLLRQRDALAGVFTWYLLPLFPGSLVMAFARIVDHGVAEMLQGAGQPWLRIVLTLFVFTAVWGFNRRAARRLQKQIDDIDELIGRDA